VHCFECTNNVLSIVHCIMHVHNAQHMYTQFVHSLHNLNKSHHM